jgi:hypothetical protein
MARETWTDERLDDLKERVDDGFRETREEFRAVRSEMNQQFAALQRLMLQLAGGMFATFVIGFLGIFATILVHG